MRFTALACSTTVVLFSVLAIPARLSAQDASSEILSFDDPVAALTAGSYSGTSPDSVNDAGAITGHYIDAHNVTLGFLRDP